LFINSRFNFHFNTGSSNNNNINNNNISSNNNTNKISLYDTISTINLTSEAIDIKSDFEDDGYNKNDNYEYADAAPAHEYHVEALEHTVQPEAIQLEIKQSEVEVKTSERRPLSIVKSNRDIDNINKELNEIFARKIYDFIGYESESSKQKTNACENLNNLAPPESFCNSNADTNSIKITMSSKHKRTAPSPPVAAINNPNAEEATSEANVSTISTTNILKSSLTHTANLFENNNDYNNNNSNNNNDHKINIVLARTILELNSSDNDDDIQRI